MRRGQLTHHLPPLSWRAGCGSNGRREANRASLSASSTQHCLRRQHRAVSGHSPRHRCFSASGTTLKAHFAMQASAITLQASGFQGAHVRQAHRPPPLRPARRWGLTLSLRPCRGGALACLAAFGLVLDMKRGPRGR